MTVNISTRRATLGDVHAVAAMAGELLNEIMSTLGVQVFNFNLAETTARLIDFINDEKYVVFVAEGADAGPVGFIALVESHALYAEGAFGIVPELFVRPAFRSKAVGMLLVEQAKAYEKSRGWARLEVTTPPLPQFDKTLAFYERDGFAITGGRKLKLAL